MDTVFSFEVFKIASLAKENVRVMCGTILSFSGKVLYSSQQKVHKQRTEYYRFLCKTVTSNSYMDVMLQMCEYVRFI